MCVNVCSDHPGGLSKKKKTQKKNSLLSSQASEEIQVQVSITAAPLTQMFPEVEVR